MPAEDEPWFQKWMSWRLRPKVSAAEVARPVQESYKAMVKNLLSPELRAMGFKGSGGRYSLPSEECWALLGFQKSTYSDAVKLQFTVNLAVVTRSDWAALRASEPFHPEKPSAQLGTSKAGHNVRIGQLYSDEPGDWWWSMRSDADSAEVASSVLDGIREYGLPWMRSLMVDHAGS
jgi:hypothetical protein